MATRRASGAARRPGPSSASSRTERAVATRARRARHDLLLATAALVGVGVMMYPPTASWFDLIRTNTVVEGYAQVVDSVGRHALDEALRSAQDYNHHEITGLLIDPFGDDAGKPGVDEAAHRYLDQLALDPQGVISRVRVPAIGVDLPVFHGSTPEVLDRGLGHLYGSSLPVGGEGTHAVLTGHSGLPDATLLSDLDKLRPGDEVDVDVLGRTLRYRVTHTDVVLPTDISHLAVQDGRDLVSLVTCTPVGINTHRLVVRAERVADADAPEPSPPARTALPPPTWLTVVAPAVGGWLLVVGRAIRWARRARGAGKRRSSDPGATGRSPVDHLDGLIEVAGVHEVVGDEQGCGAAVVRQAGQQRHDLRAARAVQGARRLVHQQHAGVVHERAGDRDALTLPARQLRGAAVGERAQADGIQQPVDPAPHGGAPFSAPSPAEFGHHAQLFARGERRKQLRLLEDDADPLAP